MFYMNKVQSTHKTLKEKWQYWARVKKNYMIIYLVRSSKVCGCSCLLPSNKASFKSRKVCACLIYQE